MFRCMVLSTPPTNEQIIRPGSKRNFLLPSWKSWFRALGNLAILKGELHTDVELSPFVNNDIEHNLGREPKGWIIVRDRGTLCSVEAYKSGAQSFTDSAWTPIELDAEWVDEGDDFDASTYQFVAPVDGLYRISTAFTIALAAGFTSIHRININATSSVYIGGTGPSATSRTVNTIEVRLTAGDIVTMDGFHSDTGGSRSVTTGLANTRMHVGLIRETWDAQTTADANENYDPVNQLRLRTTYKHTVSLWIF